MPTFGRREFLRRSAGATGGAFAGFAGLHAFAQRAAALPTTPRLVAGQGDGGYGRLHRASDELALPEGFTCNVLSMEGATMSDGHPAPGRHDGMCAFPLENGNIRLIRNHEVEELPRAGVVMGDEAAAYDPGGGAGTTSLEIDPETREVIRDFVSLNGTFRNCSGGPTPWGSWLSCEEAFFGPESGFLEWHGYVFEVPVTREAAEFTSPLTTLGRFVHEAVAVDPTSGIVYQTEDHFEAGFYRFIPSDPYREGHRGNLSAGGILQMLAVAERGRYDTGDRQRVGEVLPVRWVDIPNPNPLEGPESFSDVFKQGHDQGGARFSRLEGCCYDHGSIYFVATDGGDEELGQVWQYTPAPGGGAGGDGGTLTLIYESRNRNTLKRPDNLCVSPKGAILLCEDANERRQYIRGLTTDGRIFDLVECRVNGGELAGVTFSPDGKTMFCNTLGNMDRKQPGMTFAIWGPWDRGAI
jgi:uncharacterized protein